MSLELLKGAALVASPIAAYVDAFLKPKFAQIARSSRAEKDSFELIRRQFPIYLESAIEEHSYLQTVVFQNEKKPLIDLYQPLTVRCITQNGKEEPGILIDCYHPDFLPQHKSVVLIDDAGMGKSTVLRYLFLRCIEEKAGLPVFLELRAFTKEQSVVDHLVQKMTPMEGEINPDALRKLVALGVFVFFLDGYDEIPEAHREGVTQNLREFFSKAKQNTLILSSRPDPTLVSFANLQGFSIQGLKLEEAYSLIRKYGALGGPAEELISELERDRSSVEEFLGNPMLVSLLFKAFSYKRSVPLEKPAFYNQVFDALFEGHDLTKPLYHREKRSKLSHDKFEQVLRALGIVTLKQGVGYPKSQLLAYITQAREMCPGLDFDPSDFLHDLLRNVPLFAVEGDYHRWKHKSLQDYFAARYIWLDTKDKQSEMLLKAARDEQGRYLNMLSIFYDLDYRSFRNVVIKNLLEQFNQYCKESFSEFKNTEIDVNEIKIRKEFCFMDDLTLMKLNDEPMVTIMMMGENRRRGLVNLISGKVEKITHDEAFDGEKWKVAIKKLPVAPKIGGLTFR